ncbi:MAG: tRNA (guanosine(46)-N7)-methyltransferase TrmB, partial [Burkholderiaceae bacterium]
MTPQPTAPADSHLMTPPATPPADHSAAPRDTSTQDAPSPLKGRPIRSFVLRTGRTTVGQAKALDDLGPLYLLPYQSHAINLGATYVHSTGTTGTFGTENPSKIIFEIGFGMGEATAHIAQLMPDALYIGCEVHPPGVGALLKRIGDEQITNIRIIQHDAVEVLKHMIAPASLDGVHIFFPDPWHKKRHNKRRLIQPPLITLLASRIKPGGYIHCATDWQHYAEQILQVLSDEPTLVNTAPANAATGAD